jgi:hypothetical protein
LGKFRVLDAIKATTVEPWQTPGTVYLDQQTSFWLETKGDDDVIDKIDNGTVYKHQNWNINLDEYLLQYNIYSDQSDLNETARYEQVLETKIFNNFEENRQEGVVFFHDPWYVDANGEQPDDLPTEYREKDSPHTPFGNENRDIDGGVFNEMDIASGKPYYRTKHNTYLDVNMVQTATLPLAHGEYVLQGMFTRDRDDATVLTEHGSSFWSYSAGDGWEAASSRYANLKFHENSEVFGFYKSHLRSINEADAPTQGSSQRKIATQSVGGGYRYHSVYESGGKVFYTYSVDTGATWAPEVLISDYYHECKRPSIAFRDEFGTTHESPAVYITYVDSTESAVMLRFWETKTRPDLWYTLDSIQISSPFVCHPVVDAAIHNAKSFEVLMYEGSPTTLNASIYLGVYPLIADRISGDFTGTSTTYDYEFRDRVVATAYQNWRGITIAPRFPSIMASKSSSGGSFSAVWMETWNGSMKLKNFWIDDLGPSTEVIDTVAHYVRLNRIVAVEDARPSLGGWINPHLAYQCDIPSIRQIPTYSQNWPTTIAGRSYLQLTSRYPATTSYANASRDNVALKRGFGGIGAVYSWHPVTTVSSIPRLSGRLLEPSVGTDNKKMSISINYRWYDIAVVTVDYSAPAKVSHRWQTNGRFPALPSNLKPLQIYSTDYGFASPNSQGPPVLGSEFYWEIQKTTSHLTKESSAYEDTRLRQLVLSKNDSSFVAYGVTMPTLVSNGTTYTTLAWDYSKDTAATGYWNELSDCMKTATFTVPSNAQFEYAATLFAENQADFDDTVIVELQICLASNDSVLCQYDVNMSDYDLDSVAYVLDQFDLSSYDGSDVYFKVDYPDSTDAMSYDVLAVHFIDSAATEKANRPLIPTAQNIRLLSNYPNPFNPQTKIPYFLESAGHITLAVYDIQGNLVAELIDNMRPQGYGVVEFDGSLLPSGTYLVKLSLGDASVSRQMLLLK